MVELPSPYAMTLICNSRRMEHSVVKSPRRIKQQSTAFSQSLMCSLASNGVGTRMTTISQRIVKPAKA